MSSKFRRFSTLSESDQREFVARFTQDPQKTLELAAFGRSGGCGCEVCRACSEAGGEVFRHVDTGEQLVITWDEMESFVVC